MFHYHPRTVNHLMYLKKLHGKTCRLHLIQGGWWPQNMNYIMNTSCIWERKFSQTLLVGRMDFSTLINSYYNIISVHTNFCKNIYLYIQFLICVLFLKHATDNKILWKCFSGYTLCNYIYIYGFYGHFHLERDQITADTMIPWALFNKVNILQYKWQLRYFLL